MNKKLRITYVEDLRVVREGVNFLLGQYDYLEIVTAEFDPARIPDFILSNNIDIAILDLQLTLPPESETTNGFEICAKVSHADPDIKLIAHSMYDTTESINRFFSKGGHAFVSKKSGHQELVNAINAVNEGEHYLCKEILKHTKNADRFMNGDDPHLKAVTQIFTKAEKAILEKIAKGYSTKQIAHQLDISEKTVETHRKHLFDKAGVKNVAELIAFVYSRRIVME